MTGTVVTPRERSIEIVIDDSKPHAYLVSWPTVISDNEGFVAIRNFYETLRRDFGDNPRKIEKLFQGLILFKEDWTGPELPLEEFLDEAKFREHLGRVDVHNARIGTSYGDFFYDMERSATRRPERYLGVASHLDLGAQLPLLIQRTHAEQLTIESLPVISQVLQPRLSRYSR